MSEDATPEQPGRDRWTQLSRRFWATERPARHFRTPAQLAPLAHAVAALAARHGLTRVVDLGAGDGTLLAHLSCHAPHLELVGLDVRPRPVDRPGPERRSDGRCPIAWHRISHLAAPSGPQPVSLPDALRRELARPRTLLVLVELLDEIPAPLVAATPGGWRYCAPLPQDGRADLTRPLDQTDAAWLEQWWPERTARAVVGHPRDRLWAALLQALEPSGVALAIDYGHTRERRPPDGGLQIVRSGRDLAEPGIPLHPGDDGGEPVANVSASVATDAVRAAGERTGAVTLADTLLASAIPELAPAAPVDASPLRQLLASGQRAQLTDPAGFGSFRWLCQQPARGGTTEGRRECRL